MNSINSRADIKKLVHSFYARIRKNELLGPIFNRHISEEQWPEHLEKLTDFWETNLFAKPKFKGNPSAKHINVDSAMNHKISQSHFGEWIHLWFETIDEHFEGDIAIKAKESARKMATGQFIAIWHNRPENKK